MTLKNLNSGEHFFVVVDSSMVGDHRKVLAVCKCLASGATRWSRLADLKGCEARVNFRTSSGLHMGY